MIDLPFRVLRPKRFTSWISTFKKNLLWKFSAQFLLNCGTDLFVWSQFKKEKISKIFRRRNIFCKWKSTFNPFLSSPLYNSTTHQGVRMYDNLAVLINNKPD